MKIFNTKGILLFPAIFACGLASAQTTDNNRFIEVTVTDTMNVTPDVIEFTLNLRNQAEYDVQAAYDTETYGTDNPDFQAEMKKREEETKLKMKMVEKRFTELLAKEKIQYTRNDKSTSISMFPESMNTEQLKPFVLKFNSLEKMAQFKEKIPADILYDGTITSMSCSKYAQMEEKLMERVLAKAKKQAERVAAVSNVKLGHLMQFTDNTDNNIVKGIEQLLTGFMSRYEREKFFDVFRNMNLSKTVRVRFAIE